MTIKSSADFYAVFGAACKKALQMTLEDIHEEMRKQLKSKFYNGFSPSDYARTDGLLEAWEKEAHGGGISFGGSFEFNSAALPVNPDAWQHASGMKGTVYYGQSIAGQILDVLEAGYRGYNARTGKAIPPRPFWDEFLSKTYRKFDNWYKRHLRELLIGVVVI